MRSRKNSPAHKIKACYMGYGLVSVEFLAEHNGHRARSVLSAQTEH